MKVQRLGTHTIPNALRVNVTASARAKWIATIRPISPSISLGHGNSDVS